MNDGSHYREHTSCGRLQKNIRKHTSHRTCPLLAYMLGIYMLAEP